MSTPKCSKEFFYEYIVQMIYDANEGSSFQIVVEECVKAYLEMVEPTNG